MPLEVVLIILAIGVAAGLITQGIVILKRRRQNLTDPTAFPAAVPAKPEPRVLLCCSNPAWVAQRDLGSARGFDLVLGKCRACGTPWIDAFCVAASMGGYEPVRPEDAEAMRTIKAAELKQFMRRWAEHLA